MTNSADEIKPKEVVNKWAQKLIDDEKAKAFLISREDICCVFNAYEDLLDSTGPSPADGELVGMIEEYFDKHTNFYRATTVSRTVAAIEAKPCLEFIKQALQSKQGGDDYKSKYYELLYQVSNKHPNETRHETALRYLRQAENQNNPPQAALNETGD